MELIRPEIEDQDVNLYNSTGAGSSSFHFMNSFLGLVTSDEDDDVDENEDTTNDQEEDAYIEISLHEPTPLVPQDEEDQFQQQVRISFSAVSRVFPLPITALPCQDDQQQPIRFRAALNRLLIRLFPSTSEDLPRRQSSSRSRGDNFLIKLRKTTSTFEMMMSSLLKLRHCIPTNNYNSPATPQNNNNNKIMSSHRNKYHQILISVKNSFQKLFQLKSPTRGVRVINFKGRQAAEDEYRRSEKKNKSCPTSVKSSPIKDQFWHELGEEHEEEGSTSNKSQRMHCGRDHINCVQGAIAHCKKSLGQPDDFHF
ncbi:hypothetical protein M9H77_22225 [Catharanthus roseus]|uniref:Uncharacterized protein n=1 Tax=Catharanthus roseus TaxID=4058 RepID=A0ACC0AR27_CATRO|nr:hypothetical protein M9H77_22225 [Catharanthus roseus]